MKLQVQRLEEQQRKSLSSSERCPIWTVKAFLDVNKRLKDDKEFAQEFVSYKIVIVGSINLLFFLNSAREHYSVTLNKPRSSEIHHESNDGTLQTTGSNEIHPKRKKTRGIPARKPFYLTKVYTQLKSKAFINLYPSIYLFINNFFCALITSVATFDWYKTFTKSSYGEEKILSTKTFDDAMESWLTQKK